MPSPASRLGRFRPPLSAVVAALAFVATLLSVHIPAPGRANGSNYPIAVGASGTHLTLNGADHTFVGFDAYELGTDWGVNAGCGGMFTTAQLDAFFASLPPDSLVRVWAFQGTIGSNVTTHVPDWTGLDRVMAAAALYHQQVILVLGAQGGGCDGQVWQDPAWYSWRYAQVNDPSGTTPHSYGYYVTLAVEHFRTSPALAMWEPMSEAEASTCPTSDVSGACVGGQACPDEAVAAHTLRSFFDQIGARIRALDPAHLIEEGLLGGGQCGTQGTDWAYVGASPGVDVLSYHDYYGATPLGGDQWNGIAVRLRQAAAIGKPVIAGELGILAEPSGTGCASLSDRATQLANKINAEVAGGASGVLLWNYVLDPPQTGVCSYNIAPGDPAFGTVVSEGAKSSAG